MAGVLWPNGWMDRGATWYGGIGLGPGDIVLGIQLPPRKRGTTAPTFRPMSIVVKRSTISATAKLLFDIVRRLSQVFSTWFDRRKFVTLSVNRCL